MTSATATWRKPHFIRNPWTRYGAFAGGALYLYLAIASVQVNWARVIEGMDRVWFFVGGFLQPNFTSRWSDIVQGFAESVTMTVVATFVGVALSLPISLGAAKNVSSKPVYFICRAIITVSRSFQEIIVAIIFVALVGFGPLAGVITLAFSTIGFVAKLLAEEIEGMDRSQAEAVRSVGSSWLQWVNYGVQPQVMPRLIGLAFYRLDINFRESAIIGIVGAGGIGATLSTAFSRYEFDTVGAILITIIAIVMCLEYISSFVRKKVQ